MHPYPENTGWSGTYHGCDSYDHGEGYDMALEFHHTDGRIITMDVSVAVGGEVVDAHDERLPGCDDGFVSSVDDVWDGLISGRIPEIDPQDAKRRFWVYDTAVRHGAGPSQDELVFCQEAEESSDFTVNLDWHGSWEDMPVEAIHAVLSSRAEVMIRQVLGFDDLEKIYRQIQDEGRS